MNPSIDLYGYEAWFFEDMMFGDFRAQTSIDWLKENQYILRELKENLQVAQNQQKMNVDKHMIERVFQEGDLVY